MTPQEETEPAGDFISAKIRMALREAGINPINTDLKVYVEGVRVVPIPGDWRWKLTMKPSLRNISRTFRLFFKLMNILLSLYLGYKTELEITWHE